MIRTSSLLAGLFAVALVWFSPTAGAAEPETPPPPFDWSDVVDDMDGGDHVVGEELCAAPL